METLFSNDFSLFGLFMSSLLGATLLPGGSELVLVGVLKLHPESLWPALLLGALGNTLGGMISFGMGRLLPVPHAGAHPAAPVHPWLHWLALRLGLGSTRNGALQVPPSQSFARNAARVRRHGTPALLFAWLPFVGDLLCVAAGWLRLNPWQAAIFMLIGKFARYALIGFTI